MDPARAPLGGPAAGDKPCVFKHFYMLGDGRHAHLKGLGQFCHRGFARHQVSENRSTRRVRESSKGGGELVLGAFRGVYGSHTYSTDWLNTTPRFCCQPVCDEAPGRGAGANRWGAGKRKDRSKGSKVGRGNQGGTPKKKKASRSLRAA